jgi:hypothetical protein
VYLHSLVLHWQDYLRIFSRRLQGSLLLLQESRNARTVDVGIKQSDLLSETVFERECEIDSYGRLADSSFAA